MVKRKRQRVDTSQSPEAGEAGILSVVVSKVEADPAAPEAPQEAVLVEEDVPDTCLQPTSLQSGTHALADEERLRKDYPIAYAARELAISREEADLAERGVQYLVLRFGNRHTLIPRARKNKHEWEFFVGLDGGEETRFIDHVEVRLHQAYRPSSLRLEQPPFMTRHRTSTGSEVRALVTFRSEYQRPPLWLVWSLDLQGNGSSQTLEFELQKGGLPSNHDLETGAAVVPSDWWESRGSMLSMLGTEDWQAALLGLMWQSGRWSGPGEASEVSEAGAGVVVLDVRDYDFEGGHIRGCINRPAASFDKDADVDKFIDTELGPGVKTVVVHCALSQVRGPYTAQRYEGGPRG
ncbi:hypothetical protein F751_6434 [Auxenochlorella protothecoides]|uniref:Uncharacterized protein n=1 Tax=Auxenochlorella protothecoides TaxID=3075 RepID=A0A087SB21_AUXPR|nr:hypothetical protein F751_6434 [Auxenochlorella protothecoides]KFM22925.1 hypothetical protein F751_6434 [Auxenochlorella protothecoides]